MIRKLFIEHYDEVTDERERIYVGKVPADFIEAAFPLVEHRYGTIDSGGTEDEEEWVFVDLDLSEASLRDVSNYLVSNLWVGKNNINNPDDPYAMAQKGSEAEQSLIDSGWTLTDEMPNGWQHYEPIHIS